jgi:hypothetical protein
MPICLTISDADWTLTKDVLEVSISFLGVLVTGVLGTIGLFTWRRHIRGQDDHNLALRILAELYKFEMVLNAGRMRRIYQHEVKSESSELPPDKFSGFRRVELGFEGRINKIDASFASLAALSLTAKALWEHSVYESLKDLQFLKEEYEEYVRVWLLSTDPNEPEDEKEDHRNELAMRRDVFQHLLGFKDDFGVELESVVRHIEALLNSKVIK